MPTLGLVLTGGGARAAYQVGVLRALIEVLGEFPGPVVIAGVSAGAINAAALACDADRPQIAVDHLWRTWSTLEPDRVYRTDAPNLLRIATRWLGELALGPLFGAGTVTHLLDTAPLRELLGHELALDRIPELIDRGVLHGAAISATNYTTGTATTFFEASTEVEPWARSNRIGIRGRLGPEHVLASAAIPLFFPPVRIGGAFFGDGCVRLTAPLSPAIHLGCDRLIAIGVRYERRPEDVVAHNLTARSDGIALSEIAGVLLNAVFLDSLDTDLERLQRINRTLSLFSPARADLGLRPIPVVAVRPSKDLGHLAIDGYDRFPAFLRWLLSGIGADDSRGSDLLSYLAFEPEYIGRLLELGHRDGLAQRDAIRALVDAP